MNILRKIIGALSGMPGRSPSKPEVDEPPMSWQLVIGDTLLGSFVYVSHETPWTTAEFHASEQFASWMPYFEWCKKVDAAPDLEGESDLGQEQPSPSPELLALIQRANGHPPSLIERGTSTPQAATIHFDDNYSSGYFRY